MQTSPGRSDRTHARSPGDLHQPRGASFCGACACEGQGAYGPAEWSPWGCLLYTSPSPRD
eukprot:11500915-Alexandrium_andersonii.AAC.1